MDSKTTKQAHLRFIRKHPSAQCHLSFHLEYKSEQYGAINENVVSVRADTDTVGGLIQHTRNKVIKMLEQKKPCGNEEKENTAAGLDMQIMLTSRKNNPLEENKCLAKLEEYKSLRFTILGNKYDVIVNMPVVEEVKMPEIIYSGHSVQPSYFRAIGNDRKLSHFIWSKSKDKVDWEIIGREYFYLVAAADEGHYLKFECVPKNKMHEGTMHAVICENTVIKMPQIPKCPFEDRQLHTKQFLHGNEIRVVSYNVLSNRYTGDHQFDYCPSQYLSVDYRKQLLLKEMLGYKADLICLQEVDSSIYSTYFRKHFQVNSYGSIYDKKGNKIPEGLAIAFQKQRFSFAGQGHIVFNEEVKLNSCMRGILRILEKNPEVNELFMRQNTSMQFVRLKNKTTNQILLVANTHLFYHPDAAHIRVLQTAVCLEYLKYLLSSKEMKDKRTPVSIIFCGDFNSIPGSDVYNFLTTGMVQYNVTENCPTTLFHPFMFQSACGTPAFTNYTEDFKQCLDYIFYTNLSVVRSVPLPEECVLSANIALPSIVFPSDHVALVAELKFN